MIIASWSRITCLLGSAVRHYKGAFKQSETLLDRIGLGFDSRLN